MADATSTTTVRTHADLIWRVADKLRGVYKQSEYGKVILPLTVLRRLDCVLEPTKDGAQARANDYQNFRLVFDREFLSTIVDRVDQNDAIFKRILDDRDFKQTLLEFYAAKLYERLRRDDDQLGLAPA